jgi:ATP-dependent Clp protease ATP-binding subunit ClpA
LGKEGDFSNAIILFTSNIGSSAIIESFDKGEVPQSGQLMDIMAKHFRPEFLGRLTEIVPFAPISNQHALQIFEIHLKKEFLDLLKNLHISIEISEETKAFLAENGYNSTYGARPLKGIIRSRLRRPLAKKIVAGEVKEGDHVAVSLKKGELVWKISKAATS